MPSIKIHCWGGIGSQLFTLALALDLNKRYPKRPIKFIFHTGGVTRRSLEIDFLPEKFRYEVKDDFIEIKVVKNNNKFHIKEDTKYSIILTLSSIENVPALRIT